MRLLFIILFIANVALAVVSLFLLPARVAIHFSTGGAPDSWASKEANALVFLSLHLLLFGLFFFIPFLICRCPPHLVNLPNKDYWLKDENKAEMSRKLVSLMSEFGIAIFGFFFLVGLLTLQANLSEPVRLNQIWFMTAFIVFMLYTVFWCVKICRSFRVPER